MSLFHELMIATVLFVLVATVYSDASNEESMTNNARRFKRRLGPKPTKKVSSPNRCLFLLSPPSQRFCTPLLLLIRNRFSIQLTAKPPASPPPTSPPPTSKPTTSQGVGAAATNKEEWSTNKDKWNAFLATSTNNGRYQMVYQLNAYTLEKYRLPYTVTVGKTGQVDEVKNMDGFLVSDQDIIRMMKTVDEAFNDISDAWAANAEEVTVTYDDVVGYPTQVYIDQTSEIADEELRFTIQKVLLL